MNILVFDTSTNILYATLGDEKGIVDTRIIPSTEQNYNSAFLISTIVDILKKSDLQSDDISAIGVNIGPGSFTGLRAAITTARVMGQQLNIPVFGTASLQVYSMLNKTDRKSLCIMDARRGKAYVSIYAQDNEPILEPCAIEYDKAIEICKEEDYFIISDDRMVKTLSENGLEYIKIQEF